MLSAVIGLPANLFYGTGIPAALLIFDKARKTNGKGDVLFIDASREFEPEAEIDIPAVQKEIEKIEGKLNVTRKKMNGYLKELGSGA